jgi:hypothetical protein
MANISPEQARVELARRELARRQSASEIKQAEPTAYSEVASPLLSGASSAAFGIPKYLVNKIGGEKALEQVFPEQQTLGGKTLRVGAEVAGLVGGGAGRLATAVAGKIIPKVASSGLGLKASVGAIDSFNRSRLMANVGRGAITGGVGATTQVLNPDTNIEQQLTQGVSGTVLGGALPVIGQLKGVGKFLNRSFQVGKPSQVGEREIMRGQLRERISSLSRGVSNGVAKAGEDLKLATKQISDNLKASSKVFADALNKEAEKGFNKFQEFVPKYFKDASRVYGETLDGMIDGLTKVKNSQGQYVGKAIPKEEAIGVLQKVQADADALGIKDSPIIAKVREMVSRYSEKKAVDVREFLTDMKAARNTTSSGVQSGSKYLTHQDMASSILNDNAGDFLTKFLPEGQLGTFGDLQSSYKSIINAKKVAYKMFQPSNEELGGKAGFNLLRNLGNKGLSGITPQDRAFLDTLQKGSDFAKGAGDITKKLRSLKPEMIKKQIQAGADKDKAELAFKRFKMLAEERRTSLSTRASRVKSINDAKEQALLIGKIILGAGGVVGAGTAIGAGLQRSSSVERSVTQMGE